MFGSPPSVDLQPWPPLFSEAWGGLAGRVRTLTSRAGQGAAFEVLLDEIRDLIDSAQFDEITARVGDRKFLRALVTVWLEDNTRAAASLNESTVTSIQSQSANLSRLTSHVLIAVFLNYFDLLDGWAPGLRSRLSGFIREVGATQKMRQRGADIIEEIRAAPQLYLEQDSPKRMADFLLKAGQTLSSHLRAFGGGTLGDGRYGQLVRQELHLAQIRVADPMEDHDFLYQLRDRAVYGAASAVDPLFGHTLLRELVQRSDEAPGPAWLETILEIGGDPRLRHTDAYRTWWRPISEDHARKVTRWLSAEDLKMFLLAVEEFGQQGRVESLKRMFPARKKFMWGLYESGFVRETRLFLGDNARAAVRRYLSAEGQRADFSLYETDADTAIIYLDCGPFHIVEGSHSFRMWVYMGEPDETLVNRARRSYTRDDFIKAIPGRRTAKLHSADGREFDSFVHSGFWQRNPIYFLASQGVRLDIEALLTRDDYAEMKHKHGLPRVRR